MRTYVQCTCHGLSPVMRLPPHCPVAVSRVIPVLAATTSQRHAIHNSALTPATLPRRAVADSGLERGEVFITTKLWRSEWGYDQARAAVQQSLEVSGRGGGGVASIFRFQ